MPEFTNDAGTILDSSSEENFIPATKDIAALRPEFLRPRMPLYHPDFPFVILWSEKSGCTTIAKWFFLQLGLLEEALAYDSWVHWYEIKVFKARPHYTHDLLNAVKQGAPVVKFVRDPFARAYSSYLTVCDPLSLGEAKHWTIDTRREIIKHLIGEGAGAEEYGFSFRQYLQWLVATDRKKINPHLRQQHQERDEYLDIRYYKIERMAENLSALEQQYRLPHLAKDHPELFDSFHFHKKTELKPAAARALLDLAVPVKRGPHFPHVNFDQEVARGTDFENIVIQCFREDLVRYKYLRGES